MPLHAVQHTTNPLAPPGPCLHVSFFVFCVFVVCLFCFYPTLPFF